ncbi:hypothetical protein ABZ867_12655 [Streptomyces cinnamoneus]
MADVLPVDTASPAIAARPSATIPLTSAHLAEHDASGWIPDIHDDDCADDACTGCEPQHLAEKQQAGLLAEQRHQLYDLDVDSVCPFTGASLYPYLTTGGTP